MKNEAKLVITSLKNAFAFQIKASSLPQLDPPTNLVVNGTEITFDKVANATSYEVFADGVSIGEFSAS